MQKQEVQKFKVIPGYIVSPGPSRLYETLRVGEKRSLWKERLQIPRLTIVNLLFVFRLNT